MRSCFLLIAVFLICLGAFSAVRARYSGVELLVSHKTAEYVNSKIIPIIQSKLSGISIPDQRYGRTRIYNIHLGRLSIGSSRVAFTDSGATFRLSNIGISGSARWKYKRWFFRVSGSIHVSLSSGHLATTLTVASKGGRPDFNVGACSAHASARVRFSGGIVSWVLNRFRGYFSRRVERYLKDNVCKVLISVLNKQETQLVTSYPTSLPIGETLKFDVSLTRDPKIGRNYLHIPFVGFTSPLVSNAELNYLAKRYNVGQFRYTVTTRRMLYFIIKPYTINAALLALYRAKSFTHEFEPSFFNQNIQNILIGANSYLCGNPAECAIKVKIYAPHAPAIQLGHNTIRMYGKAILDVDLVNSRTSSSRNLLRISTNGFFCGTLRLQQNGNQLTAIPQLTCARLYRVSVESQLFGNFAGSVPVDLIRGVTQLLLPKANAYLSKGIPLQQPGSFTIKDPTIKIHPKYLEVGTNFAYNPWG